MTLHRHHSNVFPFFLVALLYITTALMIDYPTYPCDYDTFTGWKRDPENCQTFYFCLYGQPLPMPPCPSGQVWSVGNTTCVQINSTWDDCSITPHPYYCHWYYNSSASYSFYYEKYSLECPFPQLFNAKTLKCDDYQNVDCNGRFEAIDYCEYRQFRCRISHCRPCISTYGYCRGRSNGTYGVINVPTAYVTCYNGRIVSQTTCESSTQFSDILKECLSYFMLPKEEDGARPDCRFRANGYYPDELGRCNWYFECNNTRLQGFFECGNGTTFNPVPQTCESRTLNSSFCGLGYLPSCAGRQDGFYADIDGRCSIYFECKQFVFNGYSSCSNGYSLNPYQRTCVKKITSQIKPCGLQDNPCESRFTGLYPANSSNSNYYDCSNGLFIHYGECPKGQSFNASIKQCRLTSIK